MRYLIPVLLLFFACNPARKVEKAEQIVRISPQSFNKIGKEWNSLNPCANDTVGYWYSGGVDSIPYPVDVFDTLAFIAAVDSVSKECKLTYEKAYNDAIARLSSKKLAVKRPDTVLKVVVDRQSLRLKDDSIQALNVKYSFVSGQVNDLKDQLKIQSKKTTGWIWWFILAMVLAFISNFMWLYTANRIK